MNLRIRARDSASLFNNNSLIGISEEEMEKIQQQKRRSRFSDQIFTIFLAPDFKKTSLSDLKYFSDSKMNIQLTRENLGQRGGAVVYNFKRLGIIFTCIYTLHRQPPSFFFCLSKWFPIVYIITTPSLDSYF